MCNRLEHIMGVQLPSPRVVVVQVSHALQRFSGLDQRLGELQTFWVHVSERRRFYSKALTLTVLFPAPSPRLVDNALALARPPLCCLYGIIGFVVFFVLRVFSMSHS